MRPRPWHAVVALAAVLATLWALWPSNRQVAQVELMSGSAKDAVPRLEREHKRSPHDPQIYKQLLAAYEVTGAHERLLALLEETAAARPLNAEERNDARKAALAAHQIKRLLLLLDRPSQPLTESERHALVGLALQANDLGLARSFQRRWLEGHPRDLPALAEARDLALQGGDAHEALNFQRRIYAIAPSNPEADRLENMLVQAGDPAGALAFHESHGPGTDARQWHERAAQLANWSHQPDKAIAHLKAIYAQSSDPALGKHILDLMIGAKDPAALPFGTALAHAHPDDAALQTQYRNLLAANGKQDELLALAQDAVAKAPDDAQAHQTLVTFALGHRKLDLALAELHRWVHRHPNDHAALHQLAKVLVWSKRPEDGWNVYAQLLGRGDGLSEPTTPRPTARPSMRPHPSPRPSMIAHATSPRPADGLEPVAIAVSYRPAGQVLELQMPDGRKPETWEYDNPPRFVVEIANTVPAHAVSQHFAGGLVSAMTIARRGQKTHVELQLRQALQGNWFLKPGKGKVSFTLSAPGGGGGAAPAASKELREEWLSISDNLDDITPAGLANLQALVALEPTKLVIRRRYTTALMEAGDTDRAIAEQRALLKQPGATRHDRLVLANWLMLYERYDECFPLMKQLDAARALNVEVLRDLGWRAGAAQIWKDAAYFDARVVVLDPKDKAGWEALAVVRERIDDLPGAIAAWKSRLALGNSTPAQRLRTVALLSRLGKYEEAIAVLRAPGAAASIEEVREHASLAHELQRYDEEEATQREVIRRVPSDVYARVALAQLLSHRHREDLALQAYEEAMTYAPDDPDLITEVASRRFYGPQPDTAVPLLEKLAAMPELEFSSLRLLADYYQAKAPQKAAQMLDRVFASGHGDAQSYLLRGDLARGLHDETGAQAAWKQAIAHAEGARYADQEDVQEAHAQALERLGRNDEAFALWKALVVKQPGRLAPQSSLARYYLDHHDAEHAAPYVDAAVKIDARAFETRMLQVDLAEVRGQMPAAIALINQLRVDYPTLLALPAQEVSLLHDEGAYHQAYTLARETYNRQSDDTGLADLVHGMREDGASRPEALFHQEASGAMQRMQVGANVNWQASDALAWTADASHWMWGPAFAEVTGAGARYRTGPWAIDSRVALVIQNGGLQTPIGKLNLGWHPDGIDLDVFGEEAIWDESITAVTYNGREHKGGADLAWRVFDFLTLRGEGDVSDLYWQGYNLGLAHTLSFEATARPFGQQSPFYGVYQFRQRYWGTAGRYVKLPSEADFHTLALGAGLRWGPWRVNVQPGYGVDALSYASAPEISATLGFDLGTDLSFDLSGAYAGYSFVEGMPGDYEAIDFVGRYYF